MPNITVVYYSSTGNTHQLASAIAEGAGDAGAEVRLRRAPELAPEQAIDANPAWRAHHDATAGRVPEAMPEDLVWSDGFALGTPTRFGTPSAQLKQFIDQLGGLWADGSLAGKAATSFTGAANLHGGNEATLLTLYHVFAHFGTVIVPPGYTDPAVADAGGNPYGVSHASAGAASSAPEAVLLAARHQGRRLCEIAARLAA